MTADNDNNDDENHYGHHDREHEREECYLLPGLASLHGKPVGLKPEPVVIVESLHAVHLVGDVGVGCGVLGQHALLRIFHDGVCHAKFLVRLVYPLVSQEAAIGVADKGEAAVEVGQGGVRAVNP